MGGWLRSWAHPWPVGAGRAVPRAPENPGLGVGVAVGGSSVGGGPAARFLAAPRAPARVWLVGQQYATEPRREHDVPDAAIWTSASVCSAAWSGSRRRSPGTASRPSCTQAGHALLHQRQRQLAGGSANGRERADGVGLGVHHRSFGSQAPTFLFAQGNLDNQIYVLPLTGGTPQLLLDGGAGRTNPGYAAAHAFNATDFYWTEVDQSNPEGPTTVWHQSRSGGTANQIGTATFVVRWTGLHGGRRRAHRERRRGRIGGRCRRRLFPSMQARPFPWRCPLRRSGPMPPWRSSVAWTASGRIGRSRRGPRSFRAGPLAGRRCAGNSAVAVVSVCNGERR